MKRVVLAIVAAVFLIALPAAAQYDSTPSTSTPPDNGTHATASSAGTQATSEAPTQEYTHAQVPIHGSDAGLTATGTVDSWNSDEVVLHTATGLVHFKILPNTVGPTSFTDGETVAIDFERNEQGVLLAKQIRRHGEDTSAVTVSSTAMTPAKSATTSRTPSTMPSTTEPSTTSSLGDSSPYDTTNNLPATASNTPLLALLGLLSLGGAAVMRRR